MALNDSRSPRPPTQRGSQPKTWPNAPDDRWCVTMPSTYDRPLLFGLLAWQMGFVTREVLKRGVTMWAQDKGRPLGEVLAASGTMSSADRALLEQLVERQIALCDNNPKKCLATLGKNRKLRRLRKRMEHWLTAGEPHARGRRLARYLGALMALGCLGTIVLGQRKLGTGPPAGRHRRRVPACLTPGPNRLPARSQRRQPAQYARAGA